MNIDRTHDKPGSVRRGRGIWIAGGMLVAVVASGLFYHPAMSKEMARSELHPLHHHRGTEQVVVIREEPETVVIERRHPTEVMVIKKPPPAARVEVVPVRPSARHGWVPGYWIWANGKHVWVDGMWLIPPEERAKWVPGYWVHRSVGWEWAPGHWRIEPKVSVP